MTLPKVANWNERERLLEEKQALGFCFSGHLFASYAPEIRRFVSTPLHRISPGRDAVWVTGVVSASRGQMTKRGMMRIVEIDDGTAKLEITVFSELWDRYRHAIRVDDPLIICARIENDDFSGGLRGSATEILTLGEARMRFSLGIRVKLPPQAAHQGKLKELLSPWLTPTQGCPIFLRMHHNGAECDVQLPEDWRVRPEEELMRNLSQHFPLESVEVIYR